MTNTEEWCVVGCVVGCVCKCVSWCRECGCSVCVVASDCDPQ